MSEQHPYPNHVVEAVAKGLYDDDHHDEPWEQFKENGGLGSIGYYEYAQAALTAQWEASRVVDVDQLPDDAVYLNDLGGIGFVSAARYTGEVDRMEHILHWGDHK